MKPNNKIHLFLSFGFVVLIDLISFSSAKLELTNEELKALDKFRPRVKSLITHGYQTTDSYLVRWLQARKLNIDDAVEMFAEAQKWRRDNNIDSILNETFPEFSQLYKLFSDDGVDYEGRTVFTANIGGFDLRKLLIGGKRDRYIRFSQHEVEKAVSKAAERVYRSNGTFTDSRIVGITDFTGFSLRKHACLSCIPVFIKLAQEIELAYPGINGREVYINTPRIALPVLETLMAFVSEETRNAVKIFGTDRVEWTKYLRSIIPPDQLTYQFGGTKKD